jgi:chaperone modulatory protein CbpM
MNFNISDAASECKITPEQVQEFINYDWIRPLDPENLVLDEEDLSRIELIEELKGRLGVNDESISIILHLINQLKLLHQKINNFN